jgi:serine/threonine protein kinase
MNTEPIANHCPNCRAPLSTNAPQGLCPKCLLAAVAAPTEAGRRAQVDAPPPLEAVAAAFPHLEIVELIGQGGMGAVYKARQPKLDRFVALKLLPQALAADAAFAERFNREARVLARLSHPNIVAVHDFGQSGGFFYLLMEFVDGVNFRQAMAAGRFTPQQAMALVPKICEALQYAHDEGILHRDIKPSNILLDTRGRVKMADFGIAKLMGDRAQDVTLTVSGAALGTPQYMAPEQREHPEDVDQRADIFSLGVVFYEMLTGELPIGRFAPPSEKAAVDWRVDDVVFRALEKEREKRFRSAGEMRTSVEAITESAPATPSKSDVRNTAASPAEPARESRILRLSPESKPVVLLALAIVFGMLVVQLVPIPGLLIGKLVSLVRGGLLAAVWALLVAGAGGWLVWAAWQHRRRLLGPLGIKQTDATGLRSPSGVWTTDGLLGVAAVTVLLALTVRIAVQWVVLLATLMPTLRSLGPLDGWLLSAAILAAVAAMWWVVRADWKHSVTVPPSVPPPWFTRVTAWFLAVSAVAFLPTLFSLWGPSLQWHTGSLLSVTSVALLTRDSTWRRIALVVNLVLLILSAVQLANLAWTFPWRELAPGVSFGVPGIPKSVGLAIGLAVLQDLAFAAGLWVLCRRDVKASFGLAVADAEQKPDQARPLGHP